MAHIANMVANALKWTSLETYSSSDEAHKALEELEQELSRAAARDDFLAPLYGVYEFTVRPARGIPAFQLCCRPACYREIYNRINECYQPPTSIEFSNDLPPPIDRPA